MARLIAEMKTKHRPILTEAQQALLEGVQVRLITPEERGKLDRLIIEGQYLHRADFVGEQLRYVAEHQAHMPAGWHKAGSRSTTRR